MPSSPAHAVPGLPAIGEVVAGKYRLVRALGAGGMGHVFAARDLRLGSDVAVKFILRGDEHAEQRLLREARTAMALHNEHVVRVFDVGSEAGAAYLVMELLNGEDLRSVVKARGALPAVEAVDYVLQVCAAIAEAHVRGIVHRDLKLSNLFLTRAPNGAPMIKVLDFGISKTVEPASAPDTELTRTNVTLGSPSYMSPEQWRSSKTVDWRADVWSLGIGLHLLLTTMAPFTGETTTELCVTISTDPPRLCVRDRPGVPAALEDVIRRCLEKERGKRPSVVDLARMLAPFASDAGKLVAERTIAAYAGAPLLVAPAPPSSSTEVAAEPTLGPTAEEIPIDARPRARRGAWIAGGAALLVLAGGTFLAITGVSRAREARATAGAPASSIMAAPPASGAPPSPDPPETASAAALPPTTAAPSVADVASAPRTPVPAPRGTTRRARPAPTTSRPAPALRDRNNVPIVD